MITKREQFLLDRLISGAKEGRVKLIEGIDKDGNRIAILATYLEVEGAGFGFFPVGQIYDGAFEEYSPTETIVAHYTHGGIA